MTHALSTTPEVNSLVAPSRHRAVEQLRDALRRLWSSAKRPQRDGSVTSIAKGILTSERFKGLDHVVAMQFDAIDRDAPLADVEEFWHLGAAIARAKHAARTGDDPLRGATLGMLLEAERQAHNERELAMAVFLESKSYTAALKLFNAASAYDVANKMLTEFLRRRAAECQGPKLSLSRAG